ncbi:hypothetical protein [Inoviridae sp.]|nr:hypothetical protein [Inoviridae sp.]
MSKREIKAFKYNNVKSFLKLWQSLDSVSRVIHETDFHAQIRRDLVASDFFMQGCK